MTEYVNGFAICEDYYSGRPAVALVLKSHPKWQAGFLNGVGGHIETNESPTIAAMRREFQEETGLFVQDWRLTVCLEGTSGEWCVYLLFHHQDISRRHQPTARNQ